MINQRFIIILGMTSFTGLILFILVEAFRFLPIDAFILILLGLAFIVAVAMQKCNDEQRRVK